MIVRKRKRQRRENGGQRKETGRQQAEWKQEEQEYEKDNSGTVGLGTEGRHDYRDKERMEEEQKRKD